MASCILLALRHLGPLSTTPQAAAGAPAAGGTAEGDSNMTSGGAGGSGRIDPNPAPLDTARSAGTAAGALVEVLGRALDARFSEHLGSAALATVMSAVLHCWPAPPPGRPPARANDSSDSAVVPPAVAAAEGTREAEAAGVAEVVGRGYGMGWWRLDPDGRLRSSNSGSSRVGESPLDRINADAAGAGGGASQPAEQRVLEDEYGSLSLFDDPDLDAMLSGSVSSQSGTQQQVAAAEAAAAATIEKEQEEIWSSLADGARKHILPHLYEILRKTYTVARYAPGSSSCSSVLSSFDHNHRNPATAAAASLSSAAAARGAPPRVAITATSSGNRGGGGGSSGGGGNAGASSSSLATTGRSSSSSTSSSTAAVLSSVDSSRVDAGTLLELHSTAALVVLHGSSSSSSSHISGNGGKTFGTGGRSASGGGAAAAGSGRGGGVRDPGSGYNAVRDKYLDMHRMAHNPLVPQQRLLAPAFFCLALGDGCGNADKDYRQRPSSTNSSPGCTRYVSSQRPAPTLLEALRGREWEVIQLWMQAVLDPLAFPVSQRRYNVSRGSVGSGGGRRSSREPSDIVRERFEGFTRCLSSAFGGGGDSSGEISWTEQRLSLDADVVGMFEKRLVCLEQAQLAALSSEEAAVRGVPGLFAGTSVKSVATDLTG